MTTKTFQRPEIGTLAVWLLLGFRLCLNPQLQTSFICKHNLGVQHKLGSAQLGSSSVEKDLGVVVDNKLYMSEQCTALTKGYIKKGISSRYKGVIYSMLVRLQLEYCVQFWSSLYKKDLDRLVRVQRTAMEMIQGLGSHARKG